MKIWIMLLLLLLACFNPSFGSHILGGEIGYSFVSEDGNTQVYHVKVILYGDCWYPYSSLINSRLQVKIYKGREASLQSVLLTYDPAQSNIETSPICPDEADRTACTDPDSPIPGIKKFTFSSDVTITGKSPEWHFAFNGNVIDATPKKAGKSITVQNLIVEFDLEDIWNMELAVLYLDATLNNTASVNNSPTFTALPIPFFCQNKIAEYNPGATDTENDLLSFSLIPGKLMGSPAVQSPAESVDMKYIPPFTAEEPLPTLPGSFSMNASNGQMKFIPNEKRNCNVTYLVEEYREGVKIGSVMRDMAFMILDECQNNAPVSKVSDITHADIIDSSETLTISACFRQAETIAFNISSMDPDSDNVGISYKNLPPDASLIIEDDKSHRPAAHFSWDVGNAKPGKYTFFVTYKDDGCPILSEKTIPYSIIIKPYPDIQLPPDTTLCNGMPYTIIVLEQESVQYKWNTGDTSCCITINRPGSYTLTATNICGTSEKDIKIDYVKCNFCLFVPNTFSPNGDGKNDRFEIKATCPLKKYLLQVYNRLGQLQFTSLATTDSWDGTLRGRQAEMGTYYYVIRAQTEDSKTYNIQLKGDLLLIK